MKQYDELSAFCCLSLSVFTSWDKFPLAIQCVLSEGVVIDDTKCFDDFLSSKCVRENKNPEFSSLLSHEEWVVFYSKGR
jgi:hypothetical protein